jgi:hypothetical protein
MLLPSGSVALKRRVGTWKYPINERFKVALSPIFSRGHVMAFNQSCFGLLDSKTINIWTIIGPFDHHDHFIIYADITKDLDERDM